MFYMYFIRATDGPVKIGISNDPGRRLYDLQTAHWCDLELVGYVECYTEERARFLERKWHRKFKGHRMRGEWFRGTVLRRAKQQVTEAIWLRILDDPEPQLKWHGHPKM